MTNATPSKRFQVIAALLPLVLLAGLLGARLFAADAAAPARATVRPVPPPAHVPSPRALDPTELESPCWSCPEASEWPIRFRTDLDLLAPLGDGPGNAAVFLRDFAKASGARRDEGAAAEGRRIRHPTVGKVLPADDPLLLEAEPWVDQATFRTYPNLMPLSGIDTEVPNLLLAITLARSWIARGQAAEDPEAAHADFRRALRLGRLLRQEDVTLIQDLVGLACLRIGAQATYDRARADGDLPLALVASVVLGEAAAQRLYSGQKLTEVDVTAFVERDGDGRQVMVGLPEGRLDAVIRRAHEDAERRFRGEAMVSLHLVTQSAPPAQAERARAALRELADVDDALDAALARWCLENEGEIQVLPLVK